MQTPVTVVMLLHDAATEADQPVCKVFTGCSWRETRRTSASGTPQRGGAYPPPACAGLSALSPVGASAPRQKNAAHWTLKRGGKLLCGAVRGLTEAEYAALEKSAHLLYGGGCLDDRGVRCRISCGRELTPHVQAHF